MTEPSSARKGATGQGIHPCCLTIAGSDSGGNAGVQADLRTFHAYELHGCTVFTALTAQNPKRVDAILPVSADFVAAQLLAVLDSYAIGALKTGMPGSAGTVEAIAGTLAGRPVIPKVVDPVMIATSGTSLASRDTVSAVKKLLLPIAEIVTPNIPEAEMLSGRSLETEHDIQDAARRIHGEYGCKVLIKGGHAKTGPAKDILYDGKELFAFCLDRIENPVSTHGTGCTLAAALTANLALGRDIRTAVEDAKRYVHEAIATSYRTGSDSGVLGWGRGLRDGSGPERRI